MKALDIMTEKVWFCSPDQPLAEAAAIMSDKECGVVPVLDEEDQLLGIITDRDIVCRAVSEGVDCETATARDFMTPVPTVVEIDTPIEECCEMMQRDQVKRLPVVNKESQCVGIISLADVVRVAPASATLDLVRELSQASIE